MKTFVYTLFMASLFLVSASQAHAVAIDKVAITLDGKADDWFHTTQAGYQYWTPTDAVGAWANHDGQYVTNVPTWDNTAFDIEMGAVSVNSDGIFIMMVLSNPYVWEDLAISVDGENKHGYGVDLTGLGSNMGVVQERATYRVSEWETTHGNYVNLPDHSIISGTVTGYSSFIMSSLGYGDSQNGAPDYVLEGFISWAALGSPLSSVCFEFSEVSCLRDSFGLCVNKDGTSVPEPASMLLLGGGMLGVLSARRRRAVA